MNTIKKLAVRSCLAFTVMFSSLTLMYATVWADDIPTTTAATQNSSTSESSASSPEQSTDTDVTAQELPITLSSTAGSVAANMTDDSYYTYSKFSAGDTLTVTSNSDAIYGLYIKWYSIPSEWTLSYGTSSLAGGQNGFLHEYTAIPDGTNECTITFSSSSTICEIYAYSKGTLPDDVQVWDPSCDNADILVFSTHADDEILFLGGVLATYAGQQDLKVQVVYMTNYWNGARVREHEKLDGLWCSGVTYYPINGDFDDLYSTTLEAAKTTYDYDSVLSFVTEQIRRFQPLVCVTQDQNGEYGHGGHMILAESVKEAVSNSMSSDFCPESAATYGTWDTPKTYLHLYPENTITLNLRVPLSNMGGKTSLEVQDEAYKQHVSQQWCWFYISDEYEYSCANFGLYRTTVGTDTNNDMLDNITTYEEQERLAQEKAEAESQAASEAESASIAEEESKTAKKQSAEETSAQLQHILTIASILFFVALLCVLGCFCALRLSARYKERNHKRK